MKRLADLKPGESGYLEEGIKFTVDEQVGDRFVQGTCFDGMRSCSSDRPVFDSRQEALSYARKHNKEEQRMAKKSKQETSQAPAEAAPAAAPVQTTETPGKVKRTGGRQEIIKEGLKKGKSQEQILADLQKAFPEGLPGLNEKQTLSRFKAQISAVQNLLKSKGAAPAEKKSAPKEEAPAAPAKEKPAKKAKKEKAEAAAQTTPAPSVAAAPAPAATADAGEDLF